MRKHRRSRPRTPRWLQMLDGLEVVLTRHLPAFRYMQMCERCASLRDVRVQRCHSMRCACLGNDVGDRASLGGSSQGIEGETKACLPVDVAELEHRDRVRENDADADSAHSIRRVRIPRDEHEDDAHGEMHKPDRMCDDPAEDDPVKREADADADRKELGRVDPDRKCGSPTSRAP